MSAEPVVPAPAGGAGAGAADDEDARSLRSQESAAEATVRGDIDVLTRRLMDALTRAGQIKDRRFHLKNYKMCFVGSEAVALMVEEGMVETEADAVALGALLLQADILHHVTDDHEFKNEKLYYRFRASESGHGKTTTRAGGEPVSWGDFLGGVGGVGPRHGSLVPSTPHRGSVPASELEAGRGLVSAPVAPMDEHNVKLMDNVKPASWEDPLPKGNYNMVVIGAGAGGLVTAAASAGVGARVALIEENLLGGDCLNVGCVPSKALLAAAHVAATIKHASDVGIEVDPRAVKVNFAKVMERMRRLRAQIAPNDSAKRFATDLGVDVYLGRGTFKSGNTVEVNGKTLTFSKACVATGGSPHCPPVPGLREAAYETNTTIFNLTVLPKRLGIIGAGPIGCEMAQAFARLGSEVTVFCRSSRILGAEDEDAARLVQDSMERDGVMFVFDATFAKVEQAPAAPSSTPAAAAGGASDSKAADAPPLPTAGAGAPAAATTPEWAAPGGGGSGGDENGAGPRGAITVHVTVAAGATTVVVDRLLVAVGRRPNVAGMGLEAAGVEYDDSVGVKVNDKLQTSNKSIFAVGDVCSQFKFTHVADFMARIVVRNALFFGRAKFSSLVIPWATYTSPEVAHVGLYERDLEAQGTAYTTFCKKLEHVDRAILEDSTAGFVKVHCKKGTDQILGATIVANNAGDMISEITTAMTTGAGLGSFATVIHPYPTQADAIRLTGDLFNKTRLTPAVKTIFNGLMKAQR